MRRLVTRGQSRVDADPTVRPGCLDRPCRGDVGTRDKAPLPMVVVAVPRCCPGVAFRL